MQNLNYSKCEDSMAHLFSAQSPPVATAIDPQQAGTLQIVDWTANVESGWLAKVSMRWLEMLSPARER